MSKEYCKHYVARRFVCPKCAGDEIAALKAEVARLKAELELEQWIKAAHDLEARRKAEG